MYVLKVDKICFAFVDCDIYESSIEVFEYLKPRMVSGGFIMIDDFLNVDNNGKTIMSALFLNYELNQNIFFYSHYSNGQVFRVLENTLKLKLNLGLKVFKNNHFCH